MLKLAYCVSKNERFMGPEGNHARGNMSLLLSDKASPEGDQGALVLIPAAKVILILFSNQDCLLHKQYLQ